MSIDDFSSGMLTGIRNPNEPRREIELSRDEETLAVETIGLLERANIDTNKLFKLFDDWQTKRTLTTKRLFVSSSVLVTAATWIGIDYTTISILGLKVSSGSPFRFIVFILITIILSGIFYEISRRIDLSVKNAKILQLHEDLKDLKENVKKTDELLKKRNIKSFNVLYYDFQSSLNLGAQKSPPTSAFNAVKFYYKHLELANTSQKLIASFELLVIYGLGAFSAGSLLYTLVKNII